jgi:hypothetical protein
VNVTDCNGDEPAFQRHRLAYWCRAMVRHGTRCQLCVKRRDGQMIYYFAGTACERGKKLDAQAKLAMQALALMAHEHGKE